MKEKFDRIIEHINDKDFNRNKFTDREVYGTILCNIGKVLCEINENLSSISVLSKSMSYDVRKKRDNAILKKQEKNRHEVEQEAFLRSV